MAKVNKSVLAVISDLAILQCLYARGHGPDGTSMPPGHIVGACQFNYETVDDISNRVCQLELLEVIHRDDHGIRLTALGAEELARLSRRTDAPSYSWTDPSEHYRRLG